MAVVINIDLTGAYLSNDLVSKPEHLTSSDSLIKEISKICMILTFHSVLTNRCYTQGVTMWSVSVKSS
jgi:hypothetical protein